MIRIRQSEASALDIEGTLSELQELRRAILGLAEAGDGSLTIPGNTVGSPEPYDAWLRKVVVAVGVGPTRVAVHDDVNLHIVGNPDCLRSLASFFDVPADAEEGWHTHHEYYDGNQWVANDSEPLTVSLRCLTSA